MTRLGSTASRPRQAVTTFTHLLAAARLGILLGFAWVALASCTAPPARELTPVTPPDLGRLEAVARDTLEAAQQGLDQALVHRLPDEELAERFGDVGRLYLAHAFRDAAANCFQNAAILAPDAAAWPHLEGVAHQEAGRLEEAAEAFDRAIARDDASFAARLRQGRVWLDAGQLSAAAEQFRAVLSQTHAATTQEATQKARAAAYYGLGRALRTPATLDEAIRALEAARELAPDANAIHYALGQAHRDRGNAARAKEFLAHAGTRRPIFDDPHTDPLGALLEGARVHIALGSQARRLGRRAQAFELFRKAVTIEPGNARAQHNVGAMLAEAGKLAEALPYLQRATALDPAATDALFDFASALAQSGQLQASLAAFDAVLTRTPDDREARRRRDAVAQLHTRNTARDRAAGKP